MLYRLRSQTVFALLFTLLCVALTRAQTNLTDMTDGNDAVKLFQQGQDAHAAGDLKRALELYEQAIKLRPEFPEAEFQRATALLSLNRLPEAEKGFRRAIELQPDWSLPYTALGKLLVRLERYDEAEKLLRHSLELEESNPVALVALTDLYLRVKAPREKFQRVLGDLRNATERSAARADVWAARSKVELTLDDKTAATTSLDRALQLDKQNVDALMTRAELRASAGNYEGAITDALEAQRASRSSVYNASAISATLLLARMYAQVGRTDDAVKTLDALDDTSKRSPEVAALRSSLQKDCNNTTPEERAATEELLKQQPHNAALLACLGAALRTSDPARSLEL